MPPSIDPIEQQRRAALNRQRIESALGRAGAQSVDRERDNPTTVKNWKQMSVAEQQAELRSAAQSKARGWDYKDPRSAGNPHPAQALTPSAPGAEGSRSSSETAITKPNIRPVGEKEDMRRGQALVQARAQERMQRMQAHTQGSKGKALAAKAVQSLGIVKQSNFFYGIAFFLAALGDVLDLFAFSLPLFDFILGLLLLVLVYPYISDPKLRLTVYLLSLIDFVPFVGFLPFWTLATAYAWYTWAHGESTQRQVRPAGGYREALPKNETLETERTKRSWVYPGVENA